MDREIPAEVTRGDERERWLVRKPSLPLRVVKLQIPEALCETSKRKRS
jgi:hypothetical protein